MSKIGQKPIVVPEGSRLVLRGTGLSVSGPLGEINFDFPPELKLEQKENLVMIGRKSEGKKEKMLHGTFRQLIANALKGVNQGWRKDLEVKGVGFRVRLEGEDLILTLGFSHPVKVSPTKGIKFEVSENKIGVWGIDKAKVGLIADKIKRIYPPDAYKGKGIRYFGEQVILKPGKAAKAGVGAAGGAK